MQASILSLYDSDREKGATLKSESINWDEVDKMFYCIVQQWDNALDRYIDASYFEVEKTEINIEEIWNELASRNNEK